MGWTGGQLEGRFTARAAIEFEFGADFMPRVIDAARLGTVIYAAVRDVKDPSSVWALVLLAERQNGVLFTKPIDETMGPCEDDCPARILDLLTETGSKYANEWRERCRAQLAAPKPQAGDVIRFSTPFSFTDGSTRDTFVLVSGSEFKTLDNKPVRLRSWKRANYEVMS